VAINFAFLEEEKDIANISPVFQPKVYVVMRVSPKWGGTYSEIRKSYKGVVRLLEEWDFMGINMDNVRVYPVHKEWIPVRKTKDKPVSDGSRIRRTPVKCPICKAENLMKLPRKKLPNDIHWIKCDQCLQSPPIEFWKIENPNLIE
jgi:hypothetical protein